MVGRNGFVFGAPAFDPISKVTDPFNALSPCLLFWNIGKLDSVEVKKNKALHDIEVLVEGTFQRLFDFSIQI